MKFLIKYATRGRPKFFLRALSNIKTTISPECDYQILVTVDDNDPAMNTRSMRQVMKDYGCTVVWGGSESKINAINRGMESARPDWEVMVVMSDDMHFVVGSWDKAITGLVRSVWPTGLDWFAHFNDGYVGEKLPTMSIMGRTYYERDGYIYHPSYKSFSCDAEAMYVAQMRGRHHYFPVVLFHHQHPANSPRPNDETYRVNSLATQHDTDNYWHRLRNYFFEPHDHNTYIPFKQFL